MTKDVGPSGANADEVLDRDGNPEVSGEAAGDQPAGPAAEAGAAIAESGGLTAVPAPPSAGSISPWSRDYAPPAAWDLSGYPPPPPIRLEDHPPAGMSATFASRSGAGVLPGFQSVAETVALAPVPAAVAAAPTGRRVKVHLRTGITIVLFILGIAAGAVGVRLASPAHAATMGAFPALDRSALEPGPAAAVAEELVQNDVQGLSQVLSVDALTALQTQLKPLISFESATFVGATTLDHDTLAGYVVRGRNTDGSLGLVGMVIRLRDGQVVAQ